MKRFLRRILKQPVTWLANKFSSSPNLQRVHEALTELYNDCLENPGKKGLVMQLPAAEARFIIFSDQHKGAKDGSDDFRKAENNYLAALQYYFGENFHLISLGDEEELWENSLKEVVAKNKKSMLIQKQFLQQQRFTKVFGNHDIYWSNELVSTIDRNNLYDQELKIYEAVLLQLTIGENQLPVFMTHGHQGDGKSDGNWFSAWFVAKIWAPLQSFLNVNPNLPATNDSLKTVHNLFMYEWSEQDKNPVLITGHTHQPVFASLTYLERLYRKLDTARSINDESEITAITNKINYVQADFDYVAINYTKTKPYYFNSGCCCFSDGDITGIEIAEGTIRLIKWHYAKDKSERVVLEEMDLKTLAG